MNPSGPRQTQSYLRNLFQERGLKPKNKLGQNFLIDLNLIDLILLQAELSREDLVLEVGTGTGSLTGRLAEQAGAVLSVEIDPDFVQLARESLGVRPSIRVLHADILKNKNQLEPAVLELLHSALASGKLSRVKLVANLPYAVATPVIANLLLTDISFERMIITVQWEIAERFLARPGTKDYGALAVLVQSIADVELVRKLPPAVFWPRPQVASAIVCIRPRAEKMARVGNLSALRIFLRDLYAHRRKNLRGGLLAMPGQTRTKEQIDALLTELALDGASRAETLDLEQHLRLFERWGNQDRLAGGR